MEQHGSLFNYLGILRRCFCALTFRGKNSWSSVRAQEKSNIFLFINNAVLIIHPRWLSFSCLSCFFDYTSIPPYKIMDSHKHTPCYVIHKCSHSIMEGDPNVTRLPKYIPNNNSKKKTLPINKNYIKIKTQKPVSTHEIPLKKHKPINQNLL